MTTITTSWTNIKNKYVGYDGNHDVWWRMYAKYSGSSTKTIYVEGRLYVSGSSGSLYCGPTTTCGGQVGNYSRWGVDKRGTYYPGETVLWSGSDTTTGNSMYASVRFYSSPWGWTGDDLILSDTLTFDSTTAPTGLAASNIKCLPDGFSATVSVTGWGGAGSSSTRYRELQVRPYDASSLVLPYTFTTYVGDTMSSTIVVTEANNRHHELTIVPNTRYTLGMYADNGTKNTGSQRVGNYVTLASPPVIEVENLSQDSITISYEVSADGGYYPKTVQYSIDEGTTWITLATINDGSAYQDDFTISNLSPATTYTLKIKTVTTAGESYAGDYYFNISNNAFYGSVNNTAQKADILYGSVNGNSATISKLYGSVNGQTKIIHQNFGHLIYT